MMPTPDPEPTEEEQRQEDRKSEDRKCPLGEYHDPGFDFCWPCWDNCEDCADVSGECITC
jgi:hypothetical protein